MQVKIKGVYSQMKGEKSVDVIEKDDKKGIMKIAKPVGVIGALVPCTNPEATPFVKAISALKGRNSIIMAPHPRTKGTNTLAVNIMRDTLKKCGAPEDLIIGIKEPSVEESNELMKKCDLILATGGSPMVKAAYSSGTPAYGVGAGNAVTIVDSSANIQEAANKIKRSKTFDYATSCSTENSCILLSDIYDQMLKAMQDEGGYLVNSEEKKLLEKAVWPDEIHLNKNIIAQSSQRIAEIAKINLPKDKSFFMVQEKGIGKGFNFSGEKLSVITTIYKANNIDDAIVKVNAITSYQGYGHSCGIHTKNEENILKLSKQTYVSRIMVNQPQCLANSGAWTNGMPMSMTLGCGTWGKNISSENITWKHLLNITWVSREIPSWEPKLEDLFSKQIRELI